jgi:hypothetical protein
MAAIAVARYEVRPDGTAEPSANNIEASPWGEVLTNDADKKRPS